MTASRSQRLRAFTLTEVVVSCAIVAIVLLVVQSTIVLIVKTTPDGKTGPSARVAAARAIDMMTDDLAWATSITKSTATEVICTVPDRNGDGQPETIRYVWSGIAGDPLYRQINGGASISISGNVQAFALSYPTTTRLVSPGTSTTSAETLLTGYSGFGKATDDKDIGMNTGVGECFAPTLPSNATSWAVTRIFVCMKRNYSPYTAVMTLWTTSAGLPDTSLGSYTTPSAMGSSYAWVSFSFPTATGLSPGVPLCFQLQGTGLLFSTATVMAVDTDNYNPGPCYQLNTLNGGSSWSQPSEQSLRFLVYGTYVTPNPAVSQTVATSVRCRLQAGADPATQVTSAIRCLNQPVLP